MDANRTGWVFVEAMDGYGSRFWIDDPKLLNTMFRVLKAFVFEIQLCGLWGKDFDDEVGRSLDACIRQNGIMVFGDEQQIRLENIRVVEINVERSII